ncbi:MAG: hypothetical protein H6Q72_3954 [Firmicutes bacterium]|nr:hypothetical protein [Bacillota bacterium]
MNNRYPDFKKQEAFLYHEIRELSEGLDRLRQEGKDTPDTIRKLEAVLEEFFLFRQQERLGTEEVFWIPEGV